MQLFLISHFETLRRGPTKDWTRVSQDILYVRMFLILCGTYMQYNTHEAILTAIHVVTQGTDSYYVKTAQ
jgi:hypothetical protein